MTVGASGPDLFRCFVSADPSDGGQVRHRRRGAARAIAASSITRCNFFDTTGKGRELEKQARERQETSKPIAVPATRLAMGLGFRRRGGQGRRPGRLGPGQGRPSSAAGLRLFPAQRVRCGFADCTITATAASRRTVPPSACTSRRSGDTKPWKGHGPARPLLAHPAGRGITASSGRMEVLRGVQVVLA